MRVFHVLKLLVLLTATLAAQGRVATTITLTASPNPALTGQTVTVQATVTSSNGRTPTGTVHFGPLGDATLLNGVASLSVASLNVGTHHIMALYSGAPGFRPSHSAQLDVVVLGIAPTTTAVTTSQTPIPFGQAVTFTATVTSPGFTPTGTVGFIIDGTRANLPVTLVAGVATFTTSSLAVGTHSVSASYSGGASFALSTSAPITQVVDAANALTITPAPVDFGQVIVGVTSAPLTMTMTNTGSVATGPLSISNSTGDVGDFFGPAGPSTCLTLVGGVLPAGASCTFAFTFTPTTTGARTRSLTFSATPGGSATLTLVGTGLPVPQAVLALAPAGHDFGSVGVGFTSPAVTFTVTNVGTAPSGSLTIGGLQGANPGDFGGASAGTCGTVGSGLAPGASCQFELVFQPQALGARAATFVIGASPGGTVSTALTGTGTQTQLITFTPTPVDFGLVEVGVTSAPQTVTMTNTGSVATGPLSVTNSIGDVLDFLGPVGPSTCLALVGGVLPAGASCTFSFTFKPTLRGSRTRGIEFSATPGGSATITLVGTGVPVPQPILSLAPTSNDFGSVGVGITSPAATFTLTNIGTAQSGPLTIGGLQGANPGDFVGDVPTTTCTSTGLAAGSSCTIGVAFKPQALGPRSATFVIGASPGGTVSTSLSGTGVAAQLLTVTPASFDFGSVDVGVPSAPHRFTISNTGSVATGPFITGGLQGTNPGDFAGVAATSTCDDIAAVGLAAGASCDLDITFTPQVDGARSAFTTFTATPGGSVTIQLSGTGIFRIATLTISPPSHDFGTVHVGQTSPAQVFTVTNQSPSPVDIVQLGGGTFQGFFFDVNSTCYAFPTLGPGASCTVIFYFRPQVTGLHTSTVRVISAGNDTAAAAITGTGAPPFLAFSPPSYDFGNVTVGRTGGPAVLQVVYDGLPGATSASSAGFSLTGPGALTYTTTELDNCSEVLTHGGTGSCTFTVSFAPQATGPQPATLTATVVVDGTTYAASTELTGNGTDPAALTIAPAAHDFGSVFVGQSGAPVTFTVTNTGPVRSSKLSGISLSGPGAGDFTIDQGTCGAIPLDPGASCSLSVSFNPQAVGAQTAVLTATANGATSGSASLTGTGTPAASIAVTPASHDFGEVFVGQSSAPVDYIITNTGIVPTGALLSYFWGGTGAADYTTSFGTCAPAVDIAPGASCTIRVAFTPVGSPGTELEFAL